MRRSPASSRPSDASGNRTVSCSFFASGAKTETVLHKLPLSRTVVTEDTDVEMDSDEQEGEVFLSRSTTLLTILFEVESRKSDSLTKLASP